MGINIYKIIPLRESYTRQDRTVQCCLVYENTPYTFLGNSYMEEDEVLNNSLWEVHKGIARDKAMSSFENYLMSKGFDKVDREATGTSNS